MVNNDIQRDSLEIMQVIDHICAEEGIAYMLTCGTLLGAVREMGFIAWDNDADLMMHRRDIEAFEACCSKYLPALGLVYENRCAIPYVCKDGDARRKAEILILDAIPANKLVRRGQLLALTFLTLLLRKDFHYREMDLSRARKGMYWVAELLGRWTSENAQLKAFRFFGAIGNREQSEWLFCSNERRKFMEMRIDRKLVAETARVPFEGTELLVPAGWDGFLRLYYGDDYMIPKRENYYAFGYVNTGINSY